MERDRKLLDFVTKSFRKDEAVKDRLFSKQRRAVSVSLKAFLQFVQRYDVDFDIFVIVPQGRFKSFKSFVTFFPTQFKTPTESKQDRFWRIDKSVFYGGKLFSYDSFVKKCPAILESSEPIYAFRLPYNLVCMPSGAFKEFKRDYLSFLRDRIAQWGAIKKRSDAFTPSADAREVRRQEVLRLFEVYKQKKSYLKLIQEDLAHLAITKYSKQPLIVEKLNCDRSTIWRLLRSEKRV